MADVEQYKIFKNSKFEILTEEGFKNFEGIIIGSNVRKIKITTNKKSLICTPKHKLKTSKDEWRCAGDVKIGDILFGGTIIEDISKFENDDKVYDFLHVEDTHSYYANGILSKNCLMLDEFAFIRPEIAHEFYESVAPTISSSRKAKVFMSSTPKGCTGKFYEIYSAAEREGTKDWNYWKAEKIMWDEIPRYNIKGDLDYEGFKNEQISLLGGDMDSWLQEYCCAFLEDGASAINASLLEQLKADCKLPIFTFDGGDYKAWEEPIPGNVYVVGVDTAEGVGLDYSIAQILDITDLANIRQVAQFSSNTIQPYVFAEKLNQIARSWGSPYLCIERNGPGGQVIDALYEVHKYDRIIHYSMKNDARGVYQKMGIYCHTNSKYTGIMNMKYWVEHLQAVHINDINTAKEYETFRRKSNGTWRAQDGYNDDRIMALVWALIILETEITQRYFTVTAYDDVGKPKRIYDDNVEFERYLGPYGSLDSGSYGHDPSPLFFGNHNLNSTPDPEEEFRMDFTKNWKIL